MKERAQGGCWGRALALQIWVVVVTRRRKVQELKSERAAGRGSGPKLLNRF
jgi:hypothetical protein